MTKKKKCYFEISASFYLLSWSFPQICLSVCQKLRIFACERKNQRWKDMELMLIRKSGSENRPLTHPKTLMRVYDIYNNKIYSYDGNGIKNIYKYKR